MNYRIGTIETFVTPYYFMILKHQKKQLQAAIDYVLATGSDE